MRFLWWVILFLILFPIQISAQKEFGVSLGESFDFVMEYKSQNQVGTISTDLIYRINDSIISIPSGSIISISPTNFTLVTVCCPNTAITLEMTFGNHSIEITSNPELDFFPPSFIIYTDWNYIKELRPEFNENEAKLEYSESETQWRFTYSSDSTDTIQKENGDLYEAISKLEVKYIIDSSNGVVLYYSYYQESFNDYGNGSEEEQYYLHKFTRVGFDPSTKPEFKINASSIFLGFVVLVFLAKGKQSRRNMML